MYADLGPGLEIDLDPPSPGGVELLFSHAYVQRYARSTVNLLSYVQGNPLKYVDPLGLKECEIRMYAGHFTDDPTLDEIGRILDRLKKQPLEKCPAFIGGVGCFMSELQARIERMFPGRSIPGMPEGEGLTQGHGCSEGS